MQTLEKFDIRNFSDRLTPAKGKNRYICPVCGGNNLEIDPKTGKYQCFSECECKDIREAVSPWDEVRGDRTKAKPKPKPPTPALIPEGSIELAKLPEPVSHPEKRKCGHQTEIEYPYSDTQWVLRVERPSHENPKGYEKATYPYHLSETGEPIKGKGDVAWNPYRIDEVEAHGAGSWVLGVEGESCVEAARYLGLVAFTLQGSAWTEGDLTRAMLQCKTAGVTGVVYFPDHDDTGYKKASAMASAAAKAQLPFILLDPTLIWSECPHKGDIADWVKWGMEQGWDKEEFVRQLEKQFNSAAERERIRQDIESDDWDDTSDDIPDSFSPKAEFTQFTLESLYGNKPWICVGNALYYWNETHYKHSKDAVEIRRLADFCNTYAVPTKQGLTYPFAKPSKVKEALEWVKMRLSVDPELVDPPGLNCTNGVLQIEWNVVESNPVPQWRLIDHSPELYYTYEPLVKYDPDAEGVACDRLLQVLDPPQRDIFLKTIAASLDLATIRQHKGRLVRGLLLKGHGSNGKDTLREAVSMMYGRQGMTGCTLSDFASYDEGRKFPLARLRHSRCNWASENANTTRLDKIQSLKAFITGDTLSAEGKGKDENEFAPTGIALFNVNDTPKLQGTLEAIASRYGVLSFNKTFKIGADPSKGELEADPRFKYDPNFLRSEVLPAFLNRVLDALQRLMVEGIDYSCTQKALEDIQAENSHLFQFCQDTGLGYEPNGILTAGEIWERLEQWYQDNGTLTYEESANGKQKAVWTEQALPSDRNIKGANQVLGRFQQLFPKVKRVTVSHPNDGKKRVQALQGIGFTWGSNTPDGERDNSWKSPTPISTEPTPVPPQDPPQKTTENQGFHPTHPSFSHSVEKIENQLTDSGNVDQENQKNSDTPQQLGWVGCDAEASSISGVDNWGGIGVETEQTGVGDTLLEAIAPTSTTTTEVESSSDPWLDPINIQAIATDLENCQERETLALLRECWPGYAMNAACKLLKPERHAQIKRWVIELNAEAQPQPEELQVGDRVFVNCWPHTDRLGPYLIQSIEGDTAKVEGFAQLLSICELRRA
jgi:putative DNA primase/helicase